MVLLGTGSDTRSLRLPLPEYVTVWELDTAEVLTFREERLSATIVKAGGEDALPSKARTIPLEFDVTGATAQNASALQPLLMSHSFDPTKSSVFVLEHCLRFLRDSQAACSYPPWPRCARPILCYCATRSTRSTSSISRCPSCWLRGNGGRCGRCVVTLTMV